VKGFTASFRRVGDTCWHFHISIAMPRHGSPTVVFVPGLGEGNYMAPHGRVLAAYWRVVIVDMPGFGRTCGPARLRTVDEFGNALKEFLCGFVSTPAYVVGISFGAQIALAAAQAGAPVSRLVLVSPTYDSAVRSVPGQISRWLPTMLVEPPSLAIGLAKSYWHCGVRTPILAFWGSLRDPTERRVAKVDVPTLVVRGARDHIVSASWARRLASLAPNGRLATIEGRAHTLDYSAPEALAAVTVPFLGGRR
jgi:pimeloyl-ACP methyl ester carboxylesterase